MAKRENLITGEKLMTEGNAVRHYGKQMRHALKINDFDLAYAIWCKSASEVDNSLCFKCMHDDIGYCDLRRNSTITEHEKMMKFCFPSVLKHWEMQEMYMNNKCKHSGKGLKYKG